MLIHDAVVFVHVPKTAGESIVRYLIDHLPGQKTLVDEPDWPPASPGLPAVVRAKLRLKAMLKNSGLWLPRSLTIVAGKRHARLFEIRDMFAAQGRCLGDCPAILAVVRNPYDLEVSRYHYLRRGYHGVSGRARSREQRIAMEHNFELFALQAPFQGRLPARIEEWYQLDGCMPANLRIVRFEHLEADLHRAIGKFCPVTGRLPRLNVVHHEPYASYVSPRTEEAIYNKYRWLFDRQFYRREMEFVQS
ncbi:MAG: sulfotransferase domain-containing protein [Rhizomicrobium sp.]